MDERTVLSFLDTIKVDYRRQNYSGIWLNIQCPFAPFYHAKGMDNSPSFGVTIDPEKKSYYRCLACNQKGSLGVLANKLGHLRKLDYSAQAKWIELAELKMVTSRPMREWDDVWEDELSDLVENFVPDQMAQYAYPYAYGIKYLRKRGIGWQHIAKLGIRYDSWQKRVLFPVYDEAGTFMGFTGRSVMRESQLTKKNPKVRDYLGLNKKKLFLFSPKARSKPKGVPLYDRLIIVEGLFDYALLTAYGFTNVMCNMGTALTLEKVAILRAKGEPVFFFFDNDKAGYDAVHGNEDNETGEIDTSLSWAHQLYTQIPVWVIGYPDHVEAKDPGSMNKVDVLSCMKQAKLYNGKTEKDLADW